MELPWRTGNVSDMVRQHQTNKAGGTKDKGAGSYFKRSVLAALWTVDFLRVLGIFGVTIFDRIAPISNFKTRRLTTIGKSGVEIHQ